MRISIIATALALFAAPASVFAFAPSSSQRTTQSVPLSSLQAAAINVYEGAERNMAGFEEWAANCGVQRADGFQLTSQDGLDWSAYAATDLPAGQPVLSIPANMVLSSSASRNDLMSISNGGLAAAADSLSKMGASQIIPQFYLFVRILFELERGAESPYLPWLDSLPRLFYNSVSMTDFCYECLPPLVFRLSRDERVKFDNFSQVLKKIDFLSDETKEDVALLKWAHNVVFTRCLGEPGQEARIVPMADMFNHGTDTEIQINFDEEGNCNAFATYDVPSGSPLRTSYGCPTNPSVFFAKYGFLDETSPATFCKMMDIQPTPENKAIGFDFSTMLFYKENGGISQEVWDVVLYAKVLATRPDVKQRFYDAHMAGDADTKQAIHQEFMLETTTQLKNHVDTFLSQLDILSAKADGKDLNEHPRLPLILSHNEFVKSTFLLVKSNLDPMVAQAAEQRGVPV